LAPALLRPGGKLSQQLPQRTFRDFGIPDDDTAARERSVSPEIIQKVLDHCERYGMYIAG
jgi:hypothetical protein